MVYTSISVSRRVATEHECEVRKDGNAIRDVPLTFSHSSATCTSSVDLGLTVVVSV